MKLTFYYSPVSCSLVPYVAPKKEGIRNYVVIQEPFTASEQVLSNLGCDGAAWARDSRA
jgi:hypothetical protein